jgi:hypothetical protein
VSEVAGAVSISHDFIVAGEGEDWRGGLARFVDTEGVSAYLQQVPPEESDAMNLEPGEIEVLCRAIGDRVSEVYRLFFLWKGELDTSEGELTLVMESGNVFRFGVTPQGYGVRIWFDRWVDPFEEPLNAENREFVEECGKSVEVCMNGEAECQPFIGRRLMGVSEVVYIPHEEVCGLSLQFEGGPTLFVLDLIDELWVRHSLDLEEFRVRPPSPAVQRNHPPATG